MTSPGKASKVEIHGVRFDNVTRTETLAWMESMISIGGAHMICTPNADHVVRAQRDSEFRGIINQADLVVPDGMGVIYASRILGTPLKQNVGGRLLLPGMAERSATKGYRLFLLGGSDRAIAAAAARQLTTMYPGARIVGLYSPPFMPEFNEVETAHMLDAIHGAQPDVLFVCLGAPKQEKWIARNLHRLNVPVSIGVGAALDILAGVVRRPPGWMTSIGMEWLYRMAQDPRRLGRRYLIDDPIFLWWVLKQRLAAKGN